MRVISGFFGIFPRPSASFALRRILRFFVPGCGLITQSNRHTGAAVPSYAASGFHLVHSLTGTNKENLHECRLQPPYVPAGGLAAGAVLMAGNRFLQPTFAHAAGEGEAVSLDAVVNMTPEEMAKRSACVMAERKTGAPSRWRASPGLAAGKDETGRARKRGRRVSFSFCTQDDSEQVEGALSFHQACRLLFGRSRHQCGSGLACAVLGGVPSQGRRAVAA